VLADRRRSAGPHQRGSPAACYSDRGEDEVFAERGSPPLRTGHQHLQLPGKVLSVARQAVGPTGNSPERIARIEISRITLVGMAF